MTTVLGTTTVDLLISGLDHIPVPEGDEFTSDNFTFCSEPLNMVLGGNGANTAYVLAALGGSPSLCSAVGRDPLGTIVEGWLEDAGVQTDALVRSETDATATTTVIADARRNRQSFHHAGATATFTIDDVPEGVFKQADVLFVTGYQLLRGWRPEGMARALREARRAGATTLLDIGPAIDDPPTLEELAPILPTVEYVLANAYELRTCVETDLLDEAAEEVLDAGGQHVIVKHGAEGAVLYRPEGSPKSIPAFEVAVQSTVGAGDSFNAGLIYRLKRNAPLSQAIRFANATAARVVASPDGILGAPDAHSVERLMQNVPSGDPA